MANLIDIIDNAVRDLSEQTSPDITADFAVISQTSDTSPKKVKLQNLVGSVLAALRSAFTPASASGPATLQLHEDTDNGTNKVTISAPSILAADRAWAFPDADGTFASQSYVDTAVVGLLDDKGNTDCSANPNYPAASKGDVYTVSVAGKIGGASGITVEVGDVFRAIADNAGGTQASVGTSWVVTQANLVGALISGGALGTPSSGTLTNCTADGTNAVGTKNIPQNSQSTAYTTVLADAGKHLLHPAADTNARTFTIDSNANVAYPIGTAITFVNETSQVVTIAITSDTLTLAGTTTTGSRSLAQNGVATAIKVTTTKWLISGSGLT
jgi:hypothetical protein